jgi:hypothetical protein
MSAKTCGLADRGPLAAGSGGRSVYTVADRQAFLGVVALVNSLRLVGYRGRVVLLDCGLTQAQRRMLATELTLVAKREPLPPALLKWQAPLECPAQAMLLLDADIIVTQPLDEIFECIEAGRIVVAADPHSGRFFPEWETLLSLPPLRQGTYVNMGLIGLPGPAAEPLLRVVRDKQLDLDLALTRFGGVEPTAPLYHGDQNVWNAVFCTERWAGMLDVLDSRRAPQFPFEDVAVVDEATLRCVSFGTLEPLLLHHILAKPWLTPVRRNAYVVLLRRLLTGDDLAVRVPEPFLPRWLHRGLRGRIHRIGYETTALVRSQRGKLGLRRRLHRR